MNLNLNLKDFLRYLNRYKWWAIIIPVLCAIITYIFVKDLPKKYTSEALIATGITKQAQQASLVEGQSDYMSASQQFDNLLQTMKSRKVISNLGYKLILHDLQNPQKPFTKYSDYLQSLSPAKKQEAIKAYEEKYKNNLLTFPEEDKGDLKLYNLLVSMGYDENSLTKASEISRNGQSDFIKVQYTSPNPDLSAYVVNTFSNDFVLYYTNLTLSSHTKSLAVLDTILKRRQSEMSRKSAELAGSANATAASAAGAMSSQRQADVKLSQIGEAKAQHAQAVRTVNSIQASIQEIDSKLAGAGGYLSNSNNTVQENTQITNIDNQLAIANSRYVNNGFQARDKSSIDSLNAIKSRLLARSGNSGTVDQSTVRQNLISQKIQLENQLASARSTLNTIEGQLGALGPAPAVGVAPVATVDGSQQILMEDAKITADQYSQAQAQYDAIMLSAKAGSKLSVAEEGIPGQPESSKNILYLGFSYISSLLIVLLTLFVAFMLNKTIHTPEQLERITRQKVIGNINFLPDGKDLREIWSNKNENIESFSTYKDLIRSLRFELLEQLPHNQNMLGVTSLRNGEGKSFLAGSLCYAFVLMGKNVLFITEDETSILNIVTNNKNNEARDNQAFESFLVKREIQVEDRITILNRNSTKKSLMELRDNYNLAAAFDKLKETFDVVIVDMDSSEDMHKVKEWLHFCDKSIAVFEAGTNFTEADKNFVRYLSKDPGFIGWVLNKVKAGEA